MSLSHEQFQSMKREIWKYMLSCQQLFATREKDNWVGKHRNMFSILIERDIYYMYIYIYLYMQVSTYLMFYDDYRMVFWGGIEESNWLIKKLWSLSEPTGTRKTHSCHSWN